MMELEDGVMKGTATICAHTALVRYGFVFSSFEPFVRVPIVAAFTVAMSSVLGFPVVELFFGFVYLTARTKHGNPYGLPL